MAIQSHSERLATEMFVMGKYILLLFVPYHLTWDYSFNEIPPVGWFDYKVILSVLVCVGLIVYALLKLKDKNIFSFCILYFFITISVTSNFIVPIGSVMSERFLFVPSLGFCIALVYLFNKLLKIDASGKLRQNYIVLYTVSGVLIFLYLLKTIDREKDWKDNIALFEAGIKDAPNSARTHQALGNEYAKVARNTTDAKTRADLFKHGIDELKFGLNIYQPGYLGWYNLGAAYFDAGYLKEGEDASRKALVYDPNFAPAYYNIGTALAQRKQFREAIGSLVKATELDSNYTDAFSNTAAVYTALHEYKNAAPYFKRCCLLKPESKEYYDRMIRNNNAMMRDSLLEKPNAVR